MYRITKSSVTSYYTYLSVCLLIIIINHYDYLPCIITSVSTSQLILCYHLKYKIKILSFMGNISYSLYLIHVPLGQKIINATTRIFGVSEICLFISAIVATVVCIFISFLFFKIIEHPCHILSKKVTLKSR